MIFSELLGEEISEDRLHPCYVLYGEEDYRADQFVRQLRDALISPDGQGFNLERFDLAETRWADIIDAARTAPFFFSPWRIVVVWTDEESKADLSSLEQKIIRDYCLSPSARTVLVVIIPGRVKRTHPLVRFFSSLRQSTVVLEELKKLKGKDLFSWMDKRLAALGKSATQDARRRLVEIIGNDLRRLDNELQKITTFVAERKVIDIDDVHQVCDWVKTFIEWELTDALEKADYKESLLVLKRSFQEGASPPYVVGILANFFRGLLLAKLWLKEGRDRKEIFAFLKPRIQENWNTYADKFRDLFSLIEGFSDEDLNSAIRELARIDLTIKTSDAAPQVLLECFIFDYCRRVNRQRDKQKSIWRGRS